MEAISMRDLHQQRIFTANLNYFLEQKDVSQKEVADKIGVSPQTFNTWCKGIAIPRMGKIQALADYFGVNKSDLIEEHTPSSPYAKPPELPIINDGGTVKLKAFPLVGEIACHEPMFINEEHETIFAPATVNADFSFPCKNACEYKCIILYALQLLYYSTFHTL